MLSTITLLSHLCSFFLNSAKGKEERRKEKGEGKKVHFRFSLSLLSSHSKTSAYFRLSRNFSTTKQRAQFNCSKKPKQRERERESENRREKQKSFITRGSYLFNTTHTHICSPKTSTILLLLRVVNRFCSRHQVRISSDTTTGRVTVTAVGHRPSDIDSNVLPPNVPVPLFSGQHLQFLHKHGDQDSAFVLHVQKILPSLDTPATATPHSAGGATTQDTEAAGGGGEAGFPQSFEGESAERGDSDAISTPASSRSGSPNSYQTPGAGDAAEEERASWEESIQTMDAPGGNLAVPAPRAPSPTFDTSPWRRRRQQTLLTMAAAPRTLETNDKQTQVETGVPASKRAKEGSDRRLGNVEGQPSSCAAGAARTGMDEDGAEESPELLDTPSPAPVSAASDQQKLRRANDRSSPAKTVVRGATAGAGASVTPAPPRRGAEAAPRAAEGGPSPKIHKREDDVRAESRLKVPAASPPNAFSRLMEASRQTTKTTAAGNAGADENTLDAAAAARQHYGR